MQIRRRLEIGDLVHYFGLVIRKEYDCPVPGVCGFLDPSPEPKYIFVNANLPKYEQDFTIAHELGHFLRHRRRLAKKFSFWFCERQWKSPNLQRLSALMRRGVPIICNQELEADIYAFCLLLYVGQAETIIQHLEHHPKRAGWFYALVVPVSFFVALVRLPRRILAKIANSVARS
jgi:hypothetical protein